MTGPEDPADEGTPEGRIAADGDGENPRNDGDGPGGEDAADGDPAPDRPGPDPNYDPEARETGHPIDGNALMIAAAKASVRAGRLPTLLRAADDYLRERVDEYERSYERVDEADGVATYLVPEGHWAEVGEALGLADREADALRRAHEQHLLRVGSRRRRRREFESALDLREAAVVTR
ncbi:hypothetical protein [Halobaculum sp. EA56]|uniref:hypothetical protein n=1 Tax=Halobaculum sp. EA56 TaxID=3421648 RepID=UPI003EBE4DB1